MNERASKRESHEKRGGVDPLQAAIVSERARRNLVKNLHNIRNVEDWVAKAAGCSKSWLAKCTKVYNGLTPNAILREERYKKIEAVILDNPEATASYVAGQVAPHWSERNVCNFLRSYHDTNFKNLRRDLLNSEFNS